MNLTTEQLEAAEQGPVTVEAEGKEYVLLGKAIYDRVQSLFEEIDPREAYPSVLKAWDKDGSPEDQELYKDYARKS